MTGLGKRRHPGSAFLLALMPATAQAAVPTSLSSSPVSPAGMLQVLLGLIAVLAAIAAIAWLLRRFVPGQSGAGGMLRVIGGVMVGPKERLVLVELGETWLLLGVAAGRVNALHSMPKPEGQPLQSSSVPPASSFSAWLRRARRKRNGED